MTKYSQAGTSRGILTTTNGRKYYQNNIIILIPIHNLRFFGSLTRRRFGGYRLFAGPR